MDKTAIRTHVERLWDESIVGELVEYIRIPNKSVAFDRDWKAHGHMDRVVARFEDWARRQQIRGMKLEVVRLEGRTPLLFMEIPGDSNDCVLLYGHMDKQPEMSGWRDGLGPWNPSPTCRAAWFPFSNARRTLPTEMVASPILPRTHRRRRPNASRDGTSRRAA